MSFIAGWIVSRVVAMKMGETNGSIVEALHASRLKEIRGRAFVPPFSGPDGSLLSENAGLRDFKPSEDDSVTLSYDGGTSGGGRQIKVSGDGAVVVFDPSGTKKVATLSKTDCVDFFRKVLAGGLACYSDDVVDLKRDLEYPESTHGVTCGLATRFRILIPSLKVNREFSIYLPSNELRNYPDIIEYRSAVEIEKKILSFVP